MEAARSLGFAARFVSGYLYDESKIRGGPETLVGGGVTHAWTQIYLPGAGWVPLIPPTDWLAIVTLSGWRSRVIRPMRCPSREVSSVGRRISSEWMYRSRFGRRAGVATKR